MYFDVNVMKSGETDYYYSISNKWSFSVGLALVSAPVDVFCILRFFCAYPTSHRPGSVDKIQWALLSEIGLHRVITAGGGVRNTAVGPGCVWCSACLEGLGGILLQRVACRIASLPGWFLMYSGLGSNESITAAPLKLEC